MGRSSKFSLSLSRKPTTSKGAGDRRGGKAYAPPDDEASLSKPERVLGSANIREVPSRPGLPPQLSILSSPRSNGFDGGSSTSTVRPTRFPSEQEAAMSPRWPTSRASSQVLGGSYQGDSEYPSPISSVTTRRVFTQGSSDTLKSYYDPKKSPLAISQQTSASAVRDMALRKGQPNIAAPLTRSPSQRSRTSRRSGRSGEDGDRDARGKKPALLDLSKLFPRPKANGGRMLSPTKYVKSPDQMSVASDYFSIQEGMHSARAQTKRNSHLFNKKSPTTPVPLPRVVERDSSDNSKVNVRRPPKGIQHWFDAFPEDFEDVDHDGNKERPTTAPVPRIPREYSTRKRPIEPPPANADETGRGRDLNQMSHLSPDSRQGEFANRGRLQRVRHPSMQTMSSRATNASTRTGRSSISTSNLQDSSVLSFSSEEEDEERPIRAPLRRSVTTGPGDGLVAGSRMQPLPIPPRTSSNHSLRGQTCWRSVTDSVVTRRSSATTGKFNIVPSTPSTAHLSVPSKRSHRHSHARQPSSIPEDLSSPNQTTVTSPTTSTFSLTSTKSEPATQARPDLPRLMEVTEEEWAFLELLRQKRARENNGAGHHAASAHEQAEAYAHNKKPKISTKQPPPRTSGFLSMESPIDTAPPPLPSVPRNFSRRSSEDTPLVSPTSHTVRPERPLHDHTSAFDSLSEDSSNPSQPSPRRRTRQHAPNGMPSPAPSPKMPYRISPTPSLSPLDLFPSLPTPTDTTGSHASALPSPATPSGAFPPSAADVPVRVVTGSDSSHSSLDGWDLPLPSFYQHSRHPDGSLVLGAHAGENDSASTIRSPHKSGVAADPAPAVLLAPDVADHHAHTEAGSERPQRPTAAMRRRTASSDTNTIVSEAPSRPSPTRAATAIPPRAPVPARSSSAAATASLALYAASDASITRPSSSRGLSYQVGGPSVPPMATAAATRGDRRGSRRTSRGGVAAGAPAGKRASTRASQSVPGGARCSVSEDVLAAWGNLGGAVA